MKALAFERISQRYPDTAYTTIPTGTEPDDELEAALEMFWLNGSIVTQPKGDTNSYLIYLHGRTPFESNTAFRVRVVEVGQ